MVNGSKAMVAYKHVIVASHQRSGTHLTIDSLRANFEQLADDYIDLDRMLPAHRKGLQASEFSELLNKEPKIHIIKSHSTPGFMEFASDQANLSMAEQVKKDSKIIYVYRDGRDVLSSLYFFEKNMMPKPPERTFAEFLRSPHIFFNVAGRHGACGWPPEITPPEAWARHVSEWMDTNGCFGVSYEELTTDPDSALRKTASFLGLPVPASVQRIEFHQPSLLARIVRRITGKHYTSSAVQPRKGVAGDWVNHFSKDDEAFFWKAAGTAMERLGYRR